MNDAPLENARTPDPYGRTLALDDGDLVLRDGDLAMVGGERELAQGLRSMIATPLGSDVFNVNYGFDVTGTFIEPQSRRLIQTLIRLSLVRSLALDDRVLEVREVVFDDDPRFYELVPGAGPEFARQIHRSSRRFRAAVLIATNVTATTTANAELTLTLEGPTP